MKVCPQFAVATNSWELPGARRALRASFSDGKIEAFTTSGCFSGQGEVRDMSGGLYFDILLGTELLWWVPTAG